MSIPPRLDLPPGVVSERWDARGGQRAVLHIGLRAQRPWVVLVPGFTGSKEDFIAVLPLLDAAGVGAMSFDHLGQFESTHSEDPDDYALALLGDDLGALVRLAMSRARLTALPHVVGHSLGGLIAQRALVDGSVPAASFVALCTGPGALPPERWRGLPDLVAAIDAGVDLETIWAVVSAAAPEVPDPAIADFLHRRWRATSPAHLRACAQVLMTTPDLSPDMARSVRDGLPATVVWGADDHHWPIAVQSAMATAWGVPGVEMVGVAHSPNVEDPQQLVDLLVATWSGSAR